MSSVEKQEQSDNETNQINSNSTESSSIFSKKNVLIALGILLVIITCSVAIYFIVARNGSNGSFSQGLWSPYSSSNSSNGIETRDHFSNQS